MKKLLSMLLICVIVLTVIPVIAIDGTMLDYYILPSDGTLTAMPAPSEPLMPGDTFEVTVQFDGNIGFAGLPLRVYVPYGLELVGMQLGRDDLLHGLIGQPSGWSSVTGEIYPAITGSNYVFAVWGRTADFSVSYFELLTYTFRVAEIATEGATDAIKIAFATSFGYDVPVNAEREELNITLANNGMVGSVQIIMPSVYKELILITTIFESENCGIVTRIYAVRLTSTLENLPIFSRPVGVYFEQMLWEFETMAPIFNERNFI